MSTEMTLAKIENNNNDNDDNNSNAVITCKKPPSISKKGGRAINILKVALYMLRKKGNNKPSKSMVTNTALKRLMGSVRPLNYIQDGVGGMSPPHSQSPSPPPPPPPADDIPLILPPQSSPSSPDCGFVAENETVSPDDNNVAPTIIEVTSPIHHVHSSSSFSCSSASSEGMSRYESALSLYDLDSHDDDDDDDEENDEDAYYDGLQGDDMIDAKAEMFIAKFYQQMKIQG